MYAFHSTMVLRDVQERTGRTVRRDGHTGRSEGERGVYKNGRPIRSGTGWIEQQQLRERGIDHRHSYTYPGAGCVGRMGSRFRKSKITRITSQK